MAGNPLGILDFHSDCGANESHMCYNGLVGTYEHGPLFSAIWGPEVCDELPLLRLLPTPLAAPVGSASETR